MGDDSIMDDRFFENVAHLIEQARKYVGRTTDLTMVITYYEVGRMIVEEEQGGEARAKYGKRLLAELSSYLKKRLESGFSETTLKCTRKFYQVYAPSIRQAMPDELAQQKNQAMLDEFTYQKGQALLDEFKNGDKNNGFKVFPLESYPFKLS
jgi:hypothetical protein